MSNETEGAQSVKTGVQISSEILIPGGSNLIKGDIRQAGLHAGLSFIARILFGFPGAVLVSTNSITKAITGRHLHEHLTALGGTQTQSSSATPAREIVKTPSTQTPARPAAPTVPGGATLASKEQPRAAKKPRTRAATKRRKASESR
jgi:hypothetical protein